MILGIPDPCLVLLVGVSGSGKSTLAERHFAATEVVSSDACRALVADDERARDADTDAFTLVRLITRARLRRGRLTVVDATNLRARSRRQLQALARAHARPVVAVVLDLPPALCAERNRARGDRAVGEAVLADQLALLRRALGEIGRDELDAVVVLSTAAEVEALRIERVPTTGGAATHTRG